MGRRAVAVGTAVGVGVLIGVGAVTLTRDDNRPSTPPPPLAAESSCGLTGTPGEDAAGASAASWTEVAGWALPISNTDGPGRRTETGPWSCFTRTPSGAVLAGYVISMRANGLADDWRTVVRQQTVPGPGQEVLLSSVPNSSSIVTPRGFSVASYDPERSTIRYRLSTNSGDYSCTTDVRWSDGDWKLVLGDDGSTSSGCARGVPDNFTSWGPK